MLRPYIRRLRPYIRRLCPYIGCSPEHPVSRQHRLRRPPQLLFMLFWERPFSEPNVEARAALYRPELDDPGRRTVDYIDQGLQGLPPPVSGLPVVLRGYGDHQPLRLHAAGEVALERVSNGGGSG